MIEFFFLIENESSDDESSPPDSPVPYLSRTKSNVLASTSIIPSALNTLDNSTAGIF